MRPAILLLLLTLGIASVRAAQAQAFLDCRTDPFVARVSPFMPGFKCRELGTLPPSGVPVRFVADANDPTTETLAASVANSGLVVSAAIAKAVQKWGAVTRLTLHPVTFVISSPATAIPAPGGQRFRGVTLANPGTATEECIVLLDRNRIDERQAGPMNQPEDVAFVAAHELAHCVQAWSYKHRGGLTGWWVEGTASLLGSVVAPGSMAAWASEQRFLQRIPALGIVDMDYENILFFLWMWNEAPASVFEFMRVVSKREMQDAGDQRRALIAALGGLDADAKLARFGEKLANNDIPNPAGAPAGPLQPGEAVIVSEGGDVPFPGDPFTVQLRPVVFRGGTYVAEVRGAGRSSSVRAEGEREWSNNFPMQVGSEDCDKEDRWQVVSVRTDADEPTQIRALQVGKCHPPYAISGPLAVDACVVGGWIVDAEARLAMLQGWLNRDGAVASAEGALRFTFRPDNTAEIAAAGLVAEIDGNTDPPTHVHVGVDGTDTGQWSAAGGTLQYKSGGGSLALDVTVQVAGMTVSAPSRAAFSDGNWAYACSGDAVELRYTGPIEVPAGHEPHFTLRRQP